MAGETATVGDGLFGPAAKADGSAGGDAPAAPPPTGRGRLVAEIAGLALIVVLAVALVVTLVQRSGGGSDDSGRASAIAAAKAYATDVSTYDYRHLARDFGRVEAESTPAFRSSFVHSSDGLSKVLTEYKATATGKVLRAGVVSATANQAVVILFVNQTVANTAQTSGPTTDDSRIQVTLVRSGNRWLLSELKLL
jgi:Mce-associated membrane protein